MLKWTIFQNILSNAAWYKDGIGNAIHENYSTFSHIRMC